MDDFSQRHAAVEYWFLRLRAGELSFLVDFIIRKDRAAEVRVSLWVRGQGRVSRGSSSPATASDATISIGDSHFERHGSRGTLGDIEWDLTWDPGATLVDPSLPLVGRAHMLDLEILVRPYARFRGAVAVAGERFAVNDEPGAITHYWGRRLPDRWWWVSATEFVGAPNVRLEGIISTTQLWGHGRMPGHVGYLWVGDGTRSDLVISPGTGILRCRETDGALEIDSVSVRGRQHRVRARAQQASFNDLGEGIHQTLLADLELDGATAVPGTVGLESRVIGRA
jgi:hypothetical protein